VKINKIREIRFFRNLTLDDLYLLTGRKISQPKLSRIERGIAIPKKQEKEIIAKVLKVPEIELFPEKNK